MDALLTQRHIAELSRAQNGHYLMIVKKNQPTLYWAIQLVFEDPPLPRQPGERRNARTVDKAHGRWERHTHVTTTAFNPYPQWLGTAHVLRRVCRRNHERSGKVETEVTYGITRLPPELAGPAQLEHIWRGHWTIEKRLHYVRDETLLPSPQQPKYWRSGAMP